MRPFLERDCAGVRDIGVATAFHEVPRGGIFSDDEILADALIKPHTDFQPGSCFVAEADNRIIGYLIGCTGGAGFHQAQVRGMIALLFKAVARGVFSKPVNLRFLLRCLLSFVRGEFYAPDFSEQYPATLHINIIQGYRHQGIGSRLIQAYLTLVRAQGVRGVRLGTFSEDAKDFFLSSGFQVLFSGTRTYLKPYFGTTVNFYVMGKKL